jgi:hypothetical protein
VSHAELDNDVRLHVYRRFVDDGQPPTVAEVADALGVGEKAAAGSFRRLAEGRVLVLAPGTVSVWMAQPFCAFPTTFRVETPRGSWWAPCVWDAFGIIGALGDEGTVATLCPDCDEPMEFVVEQGALRPADAVAHFVVPARRWWDNIAYT